MDLIVKAEQNVHPRQSSRVALHGIVLFGVDIGHDHPPIFPGVFLAGNEHANSRPEEGTTDDNGDTVFNPLQRQEVEGSNRRSRIVLPER